MAAVGLSRPSMGMGARVAVPGAHRRLCRGRPIGAALRPRRTAALPGRNYAATVRAVAAPMSPSDAAVPSTVIACRKVALFVEPSPFSHISGMKNRFECLIKCLRAEGDEVLVVTPDPAPPREYFGAKVLNVLGMRLPFYKSPTLLLSIGLSVRVFWNLLLMKPDVIHVSCPGVIVFAAVLYSRLLGTPLVVSYHTHIPHYIPRYTWSGLVAPMWSIIRWCTRRADLTLVTSTIMKDELSENKCKDNIHVWQRGVDTDVFHPKHKSAEMRARMTDGHPEDALLVYVGRLGAEKNLDVLRKVCEEVPGVRLAFVGDGPSREELEEHFRGVPNVKFMGMIKGQELSEAYASADIFMMPSESETLGFVALEAMASGLAVVAVAAGGLLDVITRPGETALMYKSGDYEGMVAQTRRLVEDRELRAQVAAEGRSDVEKFGWSAATKKLREEQYEAAIQHGRKKRKFGLFVIGNTIRSLFAWIAGLIVALVRRLDYARDYRK
mmetsp:Transcript_37787/g.95457  ORF Transcript_37787/g.95457 Transcript_37787/m.95457 type:complete len:496 (+) Transcript_37787:109-1596(+)